MRMETYQALTAMSAVAMRFVARESMIAVTPGSFSKYEPVLVE